MRRSFFVIEIKFETLLAMKSISRSFKQWCIKNQLRKKYANKLKRNYDLNINTVEGWCDSGRVSHSRILINGGIEPTEENLQKFQEEVEAHVRELQKKYPSKPIPVVYVSRSSGCAGRS